jgi:hypothetical protein
MIVNRSLDESGHLLAPWLVDGVGQVMGLTATLMDRVAPYHLVVELARGKINQLRNQAVEWQAGGLQADPSLLEEIHNASSTFGRAICASTPQEVGSLAQAALNGGYRAAKDLALAYGDQLFAVRHQRLPRLDSKLTCSIGPSVLANPNLGEALTRSFNQVVIPLSWNTIEAEETVYRWEQADAQLAWAQQRGLEATAGPLLDWSSSQLPAWLWLWERDLASLAAFMCRFVEAAVRRYRTRIRRWQLTAGSNWTSVLGLSEDELLGLTYRLGEAARAVDPSLELVVGIAQPWGEYMAMSERSYSPFVFAENLIRYGLNLAALDVEIVMGVTQRGSYCRDPLDLSRLLDLYALLGVPLRVTLGYPSSDGDDGDADPEMRAGAGRWLAGLPADSLGESGISAAAQAEWAWSFGRLAFAKAFVQGVRWIHFSDADPHLFPHCGLIDSKGNVKPALQKLAELRDQHLK